MLRTVSELDGSAIHASDGDIGKIVEPLFDDDNWTVRYLVVNAGSWLLERKVLISPISIRGLDWDAKTVQVDLTREQVRDSPDVNADLPVSRQWERENSRHHGWPFYWGAVGFAGAGGSGPGLWGGGFYPGALAATPALGEAVIEEGDPTDDHDPQDSHLRSANEVIGYGIAACDGELGKITDFILDDETWTIRYLVVDTQNWWPGKNVLLPPRWTTSIDWPGRNVLTDFTSEMIRGAPEWDPEYAITRDYEAQLHSYYGRTGYWLMEPGENGEC